MLKTLLRILILLMVTGLVTAAIYLFFENGGASILGMGELPAGMNGAMPQGERPARPEGERGGHEGEMGFSLMGLVGLGMELAKFAVITALVVGVQALVRLAKRQRARPAAI